MQKNNPISNYSMIASVPFGDILGVDFHPSQKICIFSSYKDHNKNRYDPNVISYQLCHINFLQNEMMLE